MSDNYNEPDDDEGDDFKNLRAKAKKSDLFERENAALKREIAFVKAGIPMDDPRMGYFVKGYEGDLDPALIKQAAVDAGFLTVEAPVPDAAVDQARAGQQRVMAAASGSAPVNDGAGIMYGMEQAYGEGDLEGLSAYTQQYGITFNTESL